MLSSGECVWFHIHIFSCKHVLNDISQGN
uniref:Uncharacterized protein n=1 Tax=Anguilla anguilla TaxID=7936 RepID=A0A0E9QUT8_ANGAN